MKRQLALFHLGFLSFYQCAQSLLVDVGPAFRALQVIEVSLRETQLMHPKCDRFLYGCS
jgi:hypothetical protein